MAEEVQHAVHEQQAQARPQAEVRRHRAAHSAVLLVDLVFL
jgi:hypothetical protein